jgi:hypothetical protein
VQRRAHVYQSAKPTSPLVFLRVHRNCRFLRIQTVLFSSLYHIADFKEPPMEWTTPQHEEIDLNCEISSYANAEL